MEKIILSPIELSDLMNNLKEVVREELMAFKRAELQEKLLSASVKTCKLFQPAISRVTLNAWTAAGHLKKHSIGGRIYYKQGEVMEAAKVIQRYKSKIVR